MFLYRSMEMRMYGYLNVALDSRLRRTDGRLRWRQNNMFSTRRKRGVMGTDRVKGVKDNLMEASLTWRSGSSPSCTT